MKTFVFGIRVVVLALCFTAFCRTGPAREVAAEPPPSAGTESTMLKAVKTGSRIDVTAGDQYFTAYRSSPEEKHPFFFPVNGPSGASVTSMRNGKYPHHSSLFIGCDQLNGGNFWQEGLDRGQILSRGAMLEKDSGKEIVISETCDWKGPTGYPIRDVRRIVISAPSPELRQIDFDITLEALEAVEIKKTNHSLFSARMDPDLAPVFGGTLLDAEGRTGEKGTFGNASPWLACFGSRDGKAVEGLAILQHPDNPGFPSKWFTRDYGFLSPTPMYWPDEGKSTTIPKGGALRLRYRVLVFSGTPNEADLPRQFREYAASAALDALPADAGRRPQRGAVEVP